MPLDGSALSYARETLNTEPGMRYSTFPDWVCEFESLMKLLNAQYKMTKADSCFLA